jgi:tetratricopeptide (TPR) repeat protein
MDGVSLAETPATPSFSNLLDDTAEPPAAAGRSTGSGLPISRIQVEKRNAPVNQLDLGFSLEFEGGAQAPAATSDDAIPFPGVRVANDGGAAAQETATPPNDDMLPALEPPTSRGPSTARALRPSAKKKSIPRVYFIAGGAGVLVAVLLFVLLPLLKSAPKLEVVLAPVAAELAKDTLSSYTTASSRLVEAADKIGERGNALRLKAAELLLVGATAHGTGAADVDKADRLLTIVQTETKPVARVGVVRALLAIAKGKPREADALLGDAEANPLTVGIARLAEGQPAAAVAPLRRHAVFTPGSALAHYLLGKALLSGPTAEARKEFQAALAINPSHAGASIGLARLEETAEERLAAARSLSEKKLDAGTFEQAELQWLIGQAAAELGRSLESLDALKRAVELNRHLTAASIALGEALLGEGKYAQALERLKAAGPDVEASAAGKFCMGGALIANGKTSEGLAMVESAAKERPTDPRGPFWRAFASAGRQPPDFVAAERDFREAIKRDAKFLPASLKLAALLQQQQKPEQSLTVLREAEEAGAPPAVLQLAWGDALIVAGDPAQAETVFAKALDANPQSTPARLGIAAALEAQGKVAEAKALLEDILKSAPETQGLRERLAHVCVKLGEKNDALTYFQDEMRLGQPTRGLQLAVARIALELGKLDIALSEIKKVSSQSLHDAEAAYLMGRVREAKGEAMTALQDYRRATSWSKAPEYALALGVLLVKMNKDADARVVLADAISLFEGRMARGKIALRAGDAQGALQDFQAASKMKPDLVEPILLQGLCFDRMAQLDKAEELWRAALKIDGDAAEAHYRIGRLDMDRAKPSLAIDHFRKAAASAPQDAPWRADLQFQLAQAELLTGAKAAALADFKRFLEIAPADAPTRHEANAQVARLGGGKQVERLGGVGKHFERTTSGGKKL